MILEMKLIGKMGTPEDIIIMGMVDRLPYYYYTHPPLPWRENYIN